MAGMLDQAVHVGIEGTYGTWQAPTRSFELTADPAKAQRQHLELVGFRSGLQGPRTDRRRKVETGAEGSLNTTPLETGFGMLLRLISGSSSIAQQGATTAYLQSHNTTSAAPDVSASVQMLRASVDDADALVPWSYPGGKAHEVSWSCEPGDGDAGLLKVEIGMDYAREYRPGDVGAPAAAAGVYPSNEHPYGWDDLLITVDGSTLDFCKSMSWTQSFEVDRERYYLKRDTTKKKPIRNGITRPTGELSCEYEATADLYSSLVDGDPHELVFDWQAPTLAGVGHNFYFRTSLWVEFIGDSPESSLEAQTAQPLNFVVLHDLGGDPMVRYEYMSSDTSI